MSDCLGAGSGCGWCIPFLEKIWKDPDDVKIEERPEDYAAKRGDYIESPSEKNTF